VLNRLLIVTGLHNILNSFAWFIVGNYHGVTGDMNRFFAGDPTAGSFMAGFFPVMMFGLPAACLAMYHAAAPDRRRAVAGLLLSIALTSFLTGVTEPVEFTFMFLAPGLYLVHALLTGLSFIIMNALDVKLGFGFSAGLFDYVLNYSHATHPLLLLPVGALYFALYYGIFRFAIVRFDLKTPGREQTEAQGAGQPGETGAMGGPPSGAPLGTAAVRSAASTDRAGAYITALGGPANLQDVNACTTRLRLTVRAQDAVDAQALKGLGAMGIVRPSASALQVIVGPTAELLAGEIREALASPPEAVPLRGARAGPSVPDLRGEPAARAPVATLRKSVIEKLLAALGGDANVRAVESAASRLRVSVADVAQVDHAALGRLGLRGAAVVAPDCVHVIVGPAAQSACCALRELIGPPG
jgi:PTS system N-acetylglucosamine-specific IIC component